MSGGQQAQLALTLALARRPQLLVLDEPMAMLDPLARHDFMATVMTAIADDGVSVLLSSHVLAELERVADYLVLLSDGSVQVSGEVDDLLASHQVLTGPAAEAGAYAQRLNVVHVRRGEAQAHLLVRTNGTTEPVPPGWEAHPVSLEELTLAYMRDPSAAALPGPARKVVNRSRQGIERRDPARAGPTGREAAAVAVAADGLGHMATAQAHAGRARRAARRGRCVPADHRPADPRRLRRRGRLPPGKCTDLPAGGQRFLEDVRARRRAWSSGCSR